MAFFKIKPRKADKLFREYLLRIRKHECVRCHKVFTGNLQYLHVSHFWGRGREATRFDIDNCDLLCAIPCHDNWGHGDERSEYEAFKIKQLGQGGFDRLMVRANGRKKRDDAMDLLILKELLKDAVASPSA